VRRRALVLALALAALPGRGGAEPPQSAGDLPDYDASSAAAAVVTAANLLESERFWPYQVGLPQPWAPRDGAAPLPAGASGVLIRVEEGGFARIDFGRDGLHRVPVAATDLVERANRVRRGELDKMAPNYVLAIGPRLVDAASDPPRAFSFRDVTEQRAFLSVFADPRSADFEALARGLAPLRQRAGLLTILFPQGDQPDPEVWKRLRALGWPVPYVPDHLADAYTRSLLPEDAAPPRLLLQSPEGRVLFAGVATPAILPELAAAVDGALPAATAAAR
jgi:hypothetical protein